MAKKKKEKEPDFNWEESLETIEASNLLKAGFGYYVEVNNITINSEKELTKEFDKFKEMNAGV
mgnify:CR=1 FL=1